jgi:hypothetical protein
MVLVCEEISTLVDKVLNERSARIERAQGMLDQGQLSQP